MDEAVGYLGSYISGELQSVEGKTADEIEAKRTLVLKKIFNAGETKGQFKDPMDLFGNG